MLDEASLKQKVESTGVLDPNKKVVTYCGSGIAATWNALVLNKLGKKDVTIYDGSMTEWATDPSLPLETGESTK
ncbi:sulfurtransferase [Domibacillus aminovorans]|uniref:sulfurtransferase n=1 Tax=Domibacillus aminovorans TaxID=29332 RepID=UPI003140AE27